MRWSFAPPSGVSLVEHVMAIPVMMVKLYMEASSGGVFVTSPEVAAVLTSTPAFMGNTVAPGPLIMIGSIHGIQVWVNVDVIVKNEVYVVDHPEDLRHAAKLVIDDLVPEETALDYLAHL